MAEALVKLLRSLAYLFRDFQQLVTVDRSDASSKDDFVRERDFQRGVAFAGFVAPDASSGDRAKKERDILLSQR